GAPARWANRAAATCASTAAGRAWRSRWKASTRACAPDVMHEQITPLIITLDEAPNIGRTLDKLGWARRIVVVDSGSTDGTLELLRGYPQVDVVQHPFADFAAQCNFGLTQVATNWVLSLDADYELS